MEEFDIPIFKKAYELYKTFHGLRAVVPKADRYTLWQRAENLLLDIIEAILHASQLPRGDKLPFLEQTSTKLNMLRIFLRLAKDTKALDAKRSAHIQEIVDEVGRMLGGWMKSLRDIPPSRSGSHPLRERERERGKRSMRRKFRAPASHTLPFGLSSQLLLTLTRPPLTLSSAWLPFGSVNLPMPV